MTIYVSSPQLPYILTYEQSTLDEITEEVEANITGQAGIGGEKVGKAIDHGSHDEDARFILQWDKIVFSEVTISDPNDGRPEGSRRPYWEMIPPSKFGNVDLSY